MQPKHGRTSRDSRWAENKIKEGGFSGKGHLSTDYQGERGVENESKIQSILLEGQNVAKLGKGREDNGGKKGSDERNNSVRLVLKA